MVRVVFGVRGKQLRDGFLSVLGQLLLVAVVCELLLKSGHDLPAISSSVSELGSHGRRLPVIIGSVSELSWGRMGRGGDRTVAAGGVCG